MEEVSLHNATLAELAAEFLSRLPPEDRDKTQAEVYKFVRWLGLQRKPKELSPADVAGYAEQITPSEVKPVKSFLIYIRKRGFTTINLAVHARPKKATLKVATFSQNHQGRTVLTVEGRARLEAELVRLKTQRSNVLEEMQKAAADKDFRENAPLAAAREEKSRLEGRIEELDSTLKLAKIMDESQNTAKVEIGDTVVLSDLSSDKKLSYVLVDPREANPINGKLSVASPLGKMLLDKEKGQIVEVTAPAGIFSYRIKDIQRNQSDLH
jgi:transcription elongation factor GreA